MKRHLIELVSILLFYVTALFMVSQADAKSIEIPAALRKSGSRTFSNPQPLQQPHGPHGQLESVTDQLQDQSNLNLPEESVSRDIVETNQNEGNYNEDYDFSQEESCPDGEMYFVKSQQCVPLKCTSDSQRDPDTGLCESKLDNWGYPSGYWSGGPYSYHRGRGGTMYKVARPRFGTYRFRG